MRLIISLITTIFLASATCFAFDLSGLCGLEMMKEENGNTKYMPVIRGTWHVSESLDFKAGFSENFTIKRGGSLFQVPNHHSFRFDLKASWLLHRDTWIEWGWSNRSLIDGHDNVFVEEYGKNRNVIAIYRRF